MKDYTYIEDITSLKDNILDEKCKIIYMKRKTEDYFIHIVCCEFSDVNSLKANWKELTNNVSDVIQKGLSDLIEIPYETGNRRSRYERYTTKWAGQIERKSRSEKNKSASKTAETREGVF
ncbi:hypothetical protein LIQ95_15695 [[Ruminococcus] gnavus]|uniref:hypothetical protein n=1 Tax=Mediterraneibacter gnavus TaxID=33038 RepID=UPI001D05B343|nr:hypothetical protein [Mediterraneibacter gnavus]MCB5653607.1 hypothetical protein [Mediterraneibacter gnavus]